jgi:hypothetical protein
MSDRAATPRLTLRGGKRQRRYETRCLKGLKPSNDGSVVDIKPIPARYPTVRPGNRLIMARKP